MGQNVFMKDGTSVPSEAELMLCNGKRTTIVPDGYEHKFFSSVSDSRTNIVGTDNSSKNDTATLANTDSL